MPALRIGDWEADIPIVQGGMGVGISLSGLASAVANTGGIGVIATAGIGQFEPDWDTNSKEADKRTLQKVIKKGESQDRRDYRCKCNGCTFRFRRPCAMCSGRGSEFAFSWGRPSNKAS